MPKLLLSMALVSALVLLSVAEAPARIKRDRRDRDSGSGSDSDESLFEVDLGLLNLSGDPVDLRELKGQITIVNLWATWCGPCRMETPELVRLSKTYADRNVKVVGVAVDSDPVEIRAFARAFDIKYPLVLGSPKLGRGLSTLGLKMRGIPFTVMVDAEGRVLESYAGLVRGDALREDIERHLP